MIAIFFGGCSYILYGLMCLMCVFIISDPGFNNLILMFLLSLNISIISYGPAKFGDNFFLFPTNPFDILYKQY